MARKPTASEWALLEELAERGGTEYLAALCKAIETEVAIPSAALRPIEQALLALLSEPDRKKGLGKFATAVGLSRAKGRPRADEDRFWRAVWYWILRLDGMDGAYEPLRDGQALAWLKTQGIVLDKDGKAKMEFLESSSVRRAVRAHPEAEDFVRYDLLGLPRPDGVN
jgi:hypothetical protein